MLGCYQSCAHLRPRGGHAQAPPCTAGAAAPAEPSTRTRASGSVAHSTPHPAPPPPPAPTRRLCHRVWLSLPAPLSHAGTFILGRRLRNSSTDLHCGSCQNAKGLMAAWILRSSDSMLGSAARCSADALKEAACSADGFQNRRNDSLSPPWPVSSLVQLHTFATELSLAVQPSIRCAAPDSHPVATSGASSHLV